MKVEGYHLSFDDFRQFSNNVFVLHLNTIYMRLVGCSSVSIQPCSCDWRQCCCASVRCDIQYVSRRKKEDPVDIQISGRKLVFPLIDPWRRFLATAGRRSSRLPATMSSSSTSTLELQARTASLYRTLLRTEEGPKHGQVITASGY